MFYKKVPLLLLCFSLFRLTAANAQRLRTVPERLVAGQNIALTYDASASSLKDLSPVTGVVYYFKNYQWNAQDVALTSTGKNLGKGNVMPGKDWAFLTFKFTAGDSTDNNDNRSFGSLLLDVNDTAQNVPGGYAAWGLLRSPAYGFDIPGYLDGSKAISDTVTNMWLTQELQRHGNPTAKALLAVPYATSVFRINGGKDGPQIEAAIRFLNTPGASEENLLRIRQILLMLNQKSRVDSVEQVINTRFNNSNIKKLAAYKLYMNETDPVKKRAAGKVFLQKYPAKSAISWFDEANRIEYDRVYTGVVLMGIEKDDFKAVDEYLEELPYASTVTIYYKIIDISHSRKTMADEFLYPYSEKLVKHMEGFKDHQPGAYHLLTPQEWTRDFDDKFSAGPYLPMLFTHINICRDLGKYDEALTYARLAQSQQHYRKAALNDDYVFLLEKKGLTGEMNDALIKSMYENQASPEMITMLKLQYITKYKSDAGFDKYLQSLKNAADSKQSNNEEDKMIAIPMVEWTMADLNGHSVSFKSLQGKVVIMDFWATWCVPCKASLPGMNLAFQKYKNDPNVVFYFVDTEETAPDFKQQIRKYVKDNDYRFNVLFDNPLPEGKGTGEVFSRVSKAFQISGIPLKLIIDTKGTVRFLTSGYKGSASALADEISEMIEKTKKQN